MPLLGLLGAGAACGGLGAVAGYLAGAKKKEKAPRAAIGSRLPPVELDFNFPPTKVNIAERTKGKRVIVVGLPGAFTPTWSGRQVPGYLNKHAELKAKGIAEVIVYCCNDGAVMMAWGKNQGVEGSIVTFMSDTQGSLAAALGVPMEHPGPCAVLGTPRCQRHAIYVEDGVIKAFEVAAYPDDPAGDERPDVSLVESMLTKVPDLPPAERSAALAKVEAERQADIQAVKACTGASQVVLFVKPACPFCKDARETLQSNNFQFKEIEVSRSQKRGLQALTGQTSLPSCWVQGTYIGGCNDGPQEGQGVKPMIASGKMGVILGVRG